MHITAEHIRKALSGSLRGMESHQKMMPPNRRLQVASGDTRRLKPSSVLLLLFPEGDELFVCLIKRPSNMKHHAGQVAFPGGQIDQGEEALDTALRETWEEIGIPAGQIEVLGALSELFVDVSGFLIKPFVGWTEVKPQFCLNPSEAEKILLFPLLSIRDALAETELETVSGRLKVPCFPFEGEVIWGATAMILSEFYDVLEDNLFH
jgi:8-oxo-dGTP pyrophosphatase MutT (NUDIX family)